MLFCVAVEHIEAFLVDKAGDSGGAENLVGLEGLRYGVAADAGVDSASAVDSRNESAHSLFERRLWVEAVRVEDVDVVDIHSLETLV